MSSAYGISRNADRLVPPTINKGGAFIAPTAASDIVIWRAPWPCTLLAVKAYRAGGATATVNVRKNGTTEHLAVDLSTTAGAWVDGGLINGGLYVDGDSLELRLKSVSGSPTEVTIQAELARL